MLDFIEREVDSLRRSTIHMIKGTEFDDPHVLEDQFGEGAERILGQRVYFHKRVRLPRDLDYITASGFIYVGDGTAVADDNKTLPKGTEIIKEYQEGDPVSKPFRTAKDGPWHIRVHAHGSHDSTGAIPDRDQLVSK